MFPAEIYRAPRSWGEQSCGNLIYWNEVDKGGHLAAWEQPQLFADVVRAAFRSLRSARAAASPPNVPREIRRRDADLGPYPALGPARPPSISEARP